MDVIFEKRSYNLGHYCRTSLPGEFYPCVTAWEMVVIRRSVTYIAQAAVVVNVVSDDVNRFGKCVTVFSFFFDGR